MSILIQPYYCISYDTPAVALSFAIEFTIIFFYFIKKNRFDFSLFPLRKIYIVLLFTFIVGIIVSPLGVTETLPWVIMVLLSYFVVVLFFFELKEIQDVKTALNVLSYTAIILLTYFLFELVTQSNPVVEYLADLLDKSKGWIYHTPEKRFGSIRCQSLISICISWGALCGIFLFLWVYFNGTAYIKNNRFTYFCVILLLSIACIFSGSRSCYLLLFCIFVGLSLLYKKAGRILFLLMFLIAVYFMGDIISYIMSTASGNDNDFSGSNSEQRQMQMLAAMQVISNSPIWGLGVKGILVAQGADNEVLGGESIWLQKIISHGLIGVVGQIYIYISIGVYLFRNSIYRKQKLCLFFVIGWIGLCTMTSTPGLSEPYFFVIVILAAKAGSLLNNYNKMLNQNFKVTNYES